MENNVALNYQQRINIKIVFKKEHCGTFWTTFMVGHQLVIRYYVVTFELKTKKACNFIKKETLAHVFSCEISEIFTIPVFKEHLL